jgi:DNA polymerase I-like protein with 3'-5' exonuclease and polymerase domains
MFEKFGDLNERGPRTAFGKMLRRYQNRVLGGIVMKIIDPQARRPKFQFVKEGSPGSSPLQGPVHPLFAGVRAENGGIGEVGEVFNPPSAEPLIKEPSTDGDSGDIGKVSPVSPAEPPAEFNSIERYTLCRNGVVDVAKVAVVATTPFSMECGSGPGSSAPTRLVEGAPGRDVDDPEKIRDIQSIRNPYALVTDRDSLNDIAAKIAASQSAVALDIETYGPGKDDALDAFRGEIRLVALKIPDEPAWLLDLKRIGYDLGPLAAVLHEKEVLGHNIKFDALFLRSKCGLVFPRVWCSMTAARLLTAGLKEKNDLGVCLQRYLGVAVDKTPGKSDWGVETLSHVQLDYSATDVSHLHRLRAVLESELREAGLEKTAALEMALQPVLVGMEFRGVPLDREAANDRLRKCGEERTTLKRSLADAFGEGFNPNSPQQIKAAFGRLGIAVADTTKETLASIDNPAVKILSAYKATGALFNHLRGMVGAVGQDGCIHTSFNSTGAETGRFSSSKPNLQNLPRGNPRRCIAAPEGMVFVVADYSQVELRVAAALAPDSTMLEALQHGEDLHNKTASLVLGQTAGEVPREARQKAKAVNFGLIFGQKPKGLIQYARNSYGVEMTETEAGEFRRKYFNVYQGLKSWHEKAWVQVNKGVRETRTVIGRRRLLPKGLKDWNKFTALVNTPVQGSAGDGLKTAMVNIFKELPEGAHLVLTVHDELLALAPEALAPQVKTIVETRMREALEALFPGVPFEVEGKIVKNWSEK